MTNSDSVPRARAWGRPVPRTIPRSPFDSDEDGSTVPASDADLPELTVRTGRPRPYCTTVSNGFGFKRPLKPADDDVVNIEAISSNCPRKFRDHLDSELVKKFDAAYATIQEQVRCLDGIRGSLTLHSDGQYRDWTSKDVHSKDGQSKDGQSRDGHSKGSGPQQEEFPLHIGEPRRGSKTTTRSTSLRTDSPLPSRGHSTRATIGDSHILGTKSLGTNHFKTATQIRKLREDIEKEAGLRSIQLEKSRSRTSSLWELRANRNAKLVALDAVMGIVIVINALTIGVSSDFGTRADWLIVDSVFASVFSCELIYKMKLCGILGFFIGNDWRWHSFELALVIFAWGEVVFESMGNQLLEHGALLVLVRIFRLVRITRLLRVLRLRMFTELKVMLMCTLGGMRTLLWSAVLIFWPLYVGCLFFRETLGAVEPGPSTEFFTSVPKSFFTLFRCVVVGDCTDRSGRPLFVLITEEFGWAYAAIYCCLQMFMIFGLFNVIIALYVENVVAAAKSNEQVLRKNRLRDREFFNTKMYDLIDLLWSAYKRKHDLDGTDSTRLSSFTSTEDRTALELMATMDITQELFEEVQQDKKAKEILRDLDVADDDQLDLFGVLDADGSGVIELHELKAGIARLRGEARRGDIVSVRVLVEEVLEAIRGLHEVGGLPVFRGEICDGLTSPMPEQHGSAQNSEFAFRLGEHVE